MEGGDELSGDGPSANPAYAVDERLRTAIAQALESWTGSNQQGAVELIKPLADEGRVPALALLCWFYQQMPDGWRQAVPYVQRAADLGYPWPLQNVIGQMMQDPSLRPQTPGLLRQAAASGLQLDPIGQALGPFQQGDRETALQIITEAVGPWPYPAELGPLVERAHANVAEIEQTQMVVTGRRDEVLSAFEQAQNDVEQRTEHVQTRSDTFEALLDTATNAEVQTQFETRATAYGEEEKTLWDRGVKVLIAAAIVAVLPLLISYVSELFGKHPLTGQSFVAAHFAPALALGAIASVYLSRARGRDKAQRQAQDLSTALVTMFVYSGQIANTEERQQFIRDMGRTVIEASLNRDSSGSDVDAAGGLLDLLRRS